MRIGIFGGSFNPVHLGHLLVARFAMEQAGLERVVFLPAAVSPHKTREAWRGELADVGHRLAMARLAAADESRFAVSDLEVVRGGVSYFIDTLQELERGAILAAGDRPVLILGEDALAELHLWRQADDIVRRADFVLAPRGDGAATGPDSAALATAARELGPEAGEKLAASFLDMPRIGVSSTLVRQRVKDGLPLDWLVPPAVAAYIREHDLYR